MQDWQCTDRSADWADQIKLEPWERAVERRLLDEARMWQRIRQRIKQSYEADRERAEQIAVEFLNRGPQA